MNRFFFIIALALVGCATHSPDLPIPNNPSPGPNGEHSGIYAAIYSPSGEITGQVWYAETRDTYNALIAKFGNQFIPALTPDYHLTPDGKFFKADAIAISRLIDLKTEARKAITP